MSCLFDDTTLVRVDSTIPNQPEERAVYDRLCALDALRHGHFLLSSGRHSPHYVQCALAFVRAEDGAWFCHRLAEKIRALGLQIDAIVGPAMGAVVLSYEIGRQLGLPAFFCERTVGTDGSVFGFRRGLTLPEGARVLVVEDVVTTGRSVHEVAALLKKHRAEWVGVASLVDRSGGNHGFPVPLVSLLSIALEHYPADALPAWLASIPVVKPGSRPS